MNLRNSLFMVGIALGLTAGSVLDKMVPETFTAEVKLIAVNRSHDNIKAGEITLLASTDTGKTLVKDLLQHLLRWTIWVV
ncbi:hypothetical protein [Iodobacter ciconiae]|uniref:Uncharacterized protein n=1 Tax=Iodobacter ciconiae TaxID=2496266 RepID=A0A3S8ZVK8_9NEIS|nr:hypothetical protein [Iodobacter ciconiae]AZN37478.1 hypothetical protein EJO50_13900 [Iodobacter ciconiae]